MSRRNGTNGLRIVNKIAIGILIIGINLIFYTAVFFGVKYAAGYSYDFAYQILGDVPADTSSNRDVKVTIMKGESSMNIATKLEDAKLIVNKYSFYLKLKLKEYDIMPGTFVLNSSMTYDEILDVITDYSKSIDAEVTVEDVESTP